MPDESFNAPRHVWEEAIKEMREKKAERLKAAAEGDDSFLIDTEYNRILDALLRGYEERFGGGHTVANPDPDSIE